MDNIQDQVNVITHNLDIKSETVSNNDTTRGVKETCIVGYFDIEKTIVSSCGKKYFVEKLLPYCIMIKEII